MSYENDIRDVAIRMTIKSITDVLRAYKLENPNSSVEVGYNDGLEDAIKATQLFLKVLDRKEGELSE
jgi:hypothetical protein